MAEPTVAPAWLEALSAERLASGRRVNVIRFVGVTGFFALHVLLGGILAIRAWQGNLLFFAGYWVLAGVFFVVGRQSPAIGGAGGVVVGALDMPAVFILERASLPTSNTPEGVAGFCAGIFVFLVFLGAQGFGRRTALFVTVCAAFWEGMLQHEAGVVTEAVAATAILMALAGATSALATERSSALWGRVRGGAEERDRAEEALRQTERSFRTLIEGSPDTIAVVRGGAFVYVNHALVQCLGIATGDELVGRRYAELVHGDDREDHVQRLRVAATGSRPRTSEERLVRRDGGIVTLESAALRVSFNGEPAVMVVGRDVTEKNQMQTELARAREASVRVEKLAAVGQLAAGVAHDLRNPLSAARNAFHWLSKRVGATDTAKEPRVGKALELIDKELRACATILDELLDFARERPLVRAKISLRALVDDAASIVRPPGHVTLVNHVPEDLPQIDLDPDQFRQVLVNLMQNGSEAAPPDGGPAEVRVRAERDGEHFVLHIEDDGIGIPEENLQRVFEPLFTTRVRGTGLGLAIVATIVKRHGGTIEVTSRLKVGTTFRIRMTFAASDPRASVASLAPPAPSASR